MSSARLFRYTSLALLLTPTFFVLGWQLSEPLLDDVVTGLVLPDSTVFHVAGPMARTRYSAGIAATFGIAPALAWGTMLLHRRRVGHEPPGAAFTLYVVTPLFGGTVGVGLRMLALRPILLPSLESPLEPSPHLGDLALGSWGLTGTLFAGAGTIIAVVLKTRRPPAST